ncbi:MAG: LytTR family DNA-binding domain-containing protein [Deltaproteobacteria bacterium]|nr:LytTR family DNA-binding domain-containing protein [Deltaproteobacteria bacterium]
MNDATSTVTAPALRVLAADDELIARKRLTRLLSAMPGVELLDCHADAEQVLSTVQAEPVDVLVLDIQMPGLSGLELHALLPKPAPYVIFATAHPEHAVDAFELGAVDYVLKPIEAGRLGKAIDRARTVVAARREANRDEAVGTADLARLPVTTREGVVLLDPTGISHAVFDGTLVTLVTRDGDRHLTDASLQELTERLPTDRFVRAHRRALLNLHEVQLLRPTDSGGYLAVTRTGEEVPVSRQTARRLRRSLGL